jgi:hypothetical protein
MDSLDSFLLAMGITGGIIILFASAYCAIKTWWWFGFHIRPRFIDVTLRDYWARKIK